jgi:hypothetical protein
VPELHVELAGGLMRFTGLKIGWNQCTFSSSAIDSNLQYDAST